MTNPTQDRWRCLTTGCNPRLYGEQAATEHRTETAHRVAKWPVRSPEGQRRARHRNRSGYYDKYNVGAKSAAARLGRPSLADQIGGSRLGGRGLPLTPSDLADNGFGDEWDDAEADMGFDCDEWDDAEADMGFDCDIGN